jgi:putative Mn2+ efflux pump MntP
MNAEERSIGQLFAELTEETRTLVRQEIQLARAELSEKVAGIGTDIGSMVGGVAVLYAGFLVLLAAIVIGLAHVIGPGWAALLVGIVTLAIGGWMVTRGLQDMKHRNLKPEKTVASLKETKQWAKEQVS